jgi:methylenetetrahydrofolate reductase (NADPH)
MRFEELLATQQFLVVAQLEPSKGTNTTALLRNADMLRGRAHALLVPEMNGAIMRMGSLGASFLLRQKGLEPVVTMNCRDRNRLALQADALSAAALGLETVYVREGEPVASGDHIDASTVKDLDVIGLLDALRKLQKGTDLAGNDLAGAPRFCAGAEVNVGLSGGALEVEIQVMERKIRAGASFFFTNPVYDFDRLESFMRRVEPFKVPILPQVMLLKSVGMARFMESHMEGVAIPDDVIARLRKATDKLREGVALAADSIRRLQGLCRGALVVAVGDEERLAQVLELAGF